MHNVQLVVAHRQLLSIALDKMLNWCETEKQNLAVEAGTSQAEAPPRTTTTTTSNNNYNNNGSNNAPHSFKCKVQRISKPLESSRLVEDLSMPSFFLEDALKWSSVNTPKLQRWIVVIAISWCSLFWASIVFVCYVPVKIRRSSHFERTASHMSPGRSCRWGAKRRQTIVCVLFRITINWLCLRWWGLSAPPGHFVCVCLFVFLRPWMP